MDSIKILHQLNQSNNGNLREFAGGFNAKLKRPKESASLDLVYYKRGETDLYHSSFYKLTKYSYFSRPINHIERLSLAFSYLVGESYPLGIEEKRNLHLDNVNILDDFPTNYMQNIQDTLINPAYSEQFTSLSGDTNQIKKYLYSNIFFVVLLMIKQVNNNNFHAWVEKRHDTLREMIGYIEKNLVGEMQSYCGALNIIGDRKPYLLQIIFKRLFHLNSNPLINSCLQLSRNYKMKIYSLICTLIDMQSPVLLLHNVRASLPKYVNMTIILKGMDENIRPHAKILNFQILKDYDNHSFKGLGDAAYFVCCKHDIKLKKLAFSTSGTVSENELLDFHENCRININEETDRIINSNIFGSENITYTKIPRLLAYNERNQYPVRSNQQFNYDNNNNGSNAMM